MAKQLANNALPFFAATTNILFPSTAVAMLALSISRDLRSSATMGWLSPSSQTTVMLSSICTFSTAFFRPRCLSLGKNPEALPSLSNSLGTTANMPFSLKQQSLGRILTCPAE